MSESEEMFRENTLIQGYKSAGENFLAYRLQAVFNPIETEDDRIRHNDMIQELSVMISDNFSWSQFMREFAHLLIHWKHKPKQKQMLIKQLASKILMRTFKKEKK